MANLTPEDAKRQAEILKLQGYSLKSTRYISKAFDVFKSNAGSFVGFVLLYLTANVLLAFIPILGSLVSFVLNVILVAGFYLFTHKIIKGEYADFNTFFAPINQLGPLVLSSIVSSIIIILGLGLLFIPGIYLAVCYFLVTPLIVFYDMGFWQAMETSRKIVAKAWFEFLGFALLLGLVNFVGFLALGVGILVSLPVSFIAIYICFADIMNLEQAGTDPIDTIGNQINYSHQLPE